jgi:hypothetical protein
MSDQQDQQSQADQTDTPSFSAFFEAVPRFGQLMLLASHIQAVIMRAAVAQRKEAATFLARRCDEKLKLADTIGQAPSLKDVFTAYASFWQDAAAQYVSQAGHAAEVNSHSTIGLVDELRSETEGASSTVPLRKTA